MRRAEIGNSGLVPVARCDLLGGPVSNFRLASIVHDADSHIAGITP